ncbi:MAG: pyridoxal phosphate-dependent decarboxylase family protein [Kineosporiaceae bacterium]
MTADPSRPRPTPTESVWGDESPAVVAVLDWVAGHLARGTDPTTTARPAASLAAATGATVTPEGIGYERALEIFDTVLMPATRSQEDPLNLAYVPSAPTRAAVAFDLATSVANIFGGHWETGAGAIHAENQVLAWLAGLLGWPATAGGTFVSGGTTGNLSALVVARPTAARARRAAGLPARPAGGWLLVCTDEAHSSIRSAALVLDVDVLTVPCDDRGRLTGGAVTRVLEAAGERIFAVVASAGTTNAGIVDDLLGVADACERVGVWLHVDGAYGGAALVSPRTRGLFEGIERADSFIVDPHKWLYAPYDCCALLYRRPELAREAHAQSASYLDQVDRREWNPSDLAVHLTRRPRGLPLWFSVAVHGTDRYRAAVERSLATARVVADAVRARPYLRLVVPPELSVLLFERVGWGPEDYTTWSKRHALAGDFLCVPTRWHGECVLRLAFVNPATKAGEVVAALDTLAEP